MTHKIFTLVLSLFLFAASYAQTGTLSGKAIDGKSGEMLMGATVVVDNDNNLAASTDLDGNFTIAKIPAGKHTVKVRYIGYQEKTYEVDIKAGEVTSLNAAVVEDAVVLKDAVVTATVTKRDNESAIVMMQRNSTVIQSGISSEEMKRSPDKSSSDVIRRVSGSTIQDGKFAIIRGLSDRYNMALINNVILPSTEPDRKAFAFDVFPSNILDNIIIMKTGQANLPSEWAGGLIQLNTRDIPEKSFFNVTYGMTFNEGNTFRPFKSYAGSKTDFLGFDNSVRPLSKDFPGLIALNDLKIQGATDSLRTLGRNITNRSWKVNNNKIAYPGQSLQLSGGFAVRKKDVQLGGVFALSYSNSLRYTEGTRTRYAGTSGELDNDYSDERYNTTVSAALLGNISAVIKNNHKISWKNIFTNNSDNAIIQRNGVSYGNATEQNRTSMEFSSSKVFSTNLSGDHLFESTGIRWKWNGGFVMINRDQPRTTRYSYERPYTSSTGFGANETTDPYVFQFSYGGSDPKQGAYFYSQLREKLYNAGTDLTFPFKIKDQKQAISVGYSYQYRTRNFEARNLFIDYPGGYNDSIRFDLNVDNIINQENFANGKLTMNPFVFPTDVYSANSTTHAAYVMMENNIGERFKAVWGFRFESFKQSLTSPGAIDFDVIPQDPEPPIIRTKVVDTTYTRSYFSGAYSADSSGKVKTVFPLLPSINLIFKLNETMNLRASYSQSMSRPEFRETSPFVYYDFLRDVNLTGNVNLLQTSIHNADLRYEWFMGKGQSINASVFFKHFTNTIELTSVASGSQQSFIYNNAKTAYLVGAEVEIRKNFAFASKKLEDLVFVANLAYIYSHVDLRNVANSNSDEQIRPMQGQSPYIINLGLSYAHPTVGTGVSLLYNQVGQRLYATGEVGNPAWYEHWRPLMDLQISQKFLKGKGIVRFTISDLIAAKSIFYQNDVVGKHREYNKGKDDVVLSQKNYRTYSIQVAFNF
ncbi:MAG TPA: TonB-dependent receptor [Chitinophagales bacterium]|nr:TonB-dependent receptor [Chitinophagales bacterium]